MSKGRKRHMPSPETKEDPKNTELLEIIEKQQNQMVQQLQEENDYLKRIGKCQAAPFARRHGVEKPKRPGRKHRPHLLRFLYVDDLEPTNNLLESDYMMENPDYAGHWVYFATVFIPGGTRITISVQAMDGPGGMGVRSCRITIP